MNRPPERLQSAQILPARFRTSAARVESSQIEGNALNPSGELTASEPRHRVEPIGTVIEAGHEIERLAPRASKLLATQVSDFVESLQTVRHEAGA